MQLAALQALAPSFTNIADHKTLTKLATRISEKFYVDDPDICQTALITIVNGLSSVENPTTKQTIKTIIDCKIKTLKPKDAECFATDLQFFLTEVPTQTILALNSPTIVVQDAPQPQPVTRETLIIIGKAITNNDSTRPVIMKTFTASDNICPVMLKDNKGDIAVVIDNKAAPLTGEGNIQDHVRKMYGPQTQNGQTYAEFLKNAALMKPELNGKIMPEYNLA